MDIPRFTQPDINPRLLGVDIGDTFQIFSHELLLIDYPNLHLFPGRGKDGGIDLSHTNENFRTVVECKFIGKKGLKPSQQRWREVAKKLTKNLSDPDGPPKGQPQYRPWYRTEPTISKYVFCVSSLLSTLDKNDVLTQEISKFFSKLSEEFNHLSHLKGISVEVLDWSDLTKRLRDRPHLGFRWFPKTRPQGLIPFDEMPDRGTFRDYLTSEKLPYYSRQEHMREEEIVGEEDIPSEDALLKQLEERDTTGLIVTGIGGVGKTRLTIEVAKLAQNSGWIVFRAQRRLKEEAVEELAEWITSETRVLILMDYIETQKNFSEIVDILNVLNDTYSFHLRYIASCRASFYRTISTLGRQKQVDLSPISADSISRWLENFRHQVVLHILENSGLKVTDDHLTVCSKIPVIAVFISYLHLNGREEDLADLLGEKDFGKWVIKRVQLSFGQAEIARNLALLISCFQFPVSLFSRFDQDKFGELLDKLSVDGWVERGSSKGSDEELWVSAHDVLADQILLAYLENIPHTVDRFLDELLNLASKVGVLRSVLVTLQRVFDQPVFKNLKWAKVLGDNIEENSAEWRGVRDILIRSSLLTTLEQVRFLDYHREVWDGAEREIHFQNELGWLTRQFIKEKPTKFEAEVRGILETWIEKTVPHVRNSNFLLTWGLRFSPELVKPVAMGWLLAKPTLFQTHYLMVAWLESDFPSKAIATSVAQWMEKYQNLIHLSFIFRAWLDAGGDLEMVEKQIEEWLKHYGETEEAGFVYKAWLDAGGDLEMVEKQIEEWLKHYGETEQAGFVYKAWLDSGGELEVVERQIEKWLKHFGETAEVRFVLIAWLDTGGDLEMVEKQIEEWLKHYGETEEAGFVYKAWLDAGGELEVVERQIEKWLMHSVDMTNADFVYKAWLDTGGDMEKVENHIEAWLKQHGEAAEAGFVYKAWLDAGGDLEMVEKQVEEWLKHYGETTEAHFVYKAWLDAGGDMEKVEDHIEAWLKQHGEAVEADFVYKAWLEQGGDFSLVRSSAIAWLHLYFEKEEAVYLTKSLAKRKDIPVSTVRDILAWCRKFPHNEDALWRLTQLGVHLFIEEISEDVCSTSEAIVRNYSKHKTLRNTTRGQIPALFSYLISSSSLRSGQFRKRVDLLFLNWLRHPQSFGADLNPHLGLQRTSYFKRVLDLLIEGELTLEADNDHLVRFLEWVNNWQPDRKEKIVDAHNFLARKFPDPNLWEIVQFS